MAEEDRKILDKEGSVTMALKDYNEMRDLLETLLNSTDTHKEFIVKFRKSLTMLLIKSKEVGIDIDPLFEYFVDLSFAPIEGVTVVKNEGPFKEGEPHPRWTVILTKKTVEDEGFSLTND